MKITKTQNLFLRTCVLCFAISSLSGCLALVAGGFTQTALILGDRRTVSVVTIDRGLQLEADSIIAQKFQDDAHINVNVFNQKILLTGEVKTADLRSQIQNSIGSLKNIRSLANELQIGSSSSTNSRLSDSAIFTLVKARLIATSDVPTNSMKVTVEAGNVYLMGITTELEAQAAATVVSKSSSNIKQVVKIFDIISEEEKRKLVGVPASSPNK